MQEKALLLFCDAGACLFGGHYKSILLHWAGPRCVVGLTAALNGCKDGICIMSVCLCVCVEVQANKSSLGH